LTEVTLFVDGGIRDKLMAYGYLAVDPRDESIELFRGFNTCGTGTSNIAEYRAIIAGLEGCVRQNVHIVHIKSDSQLIVQQILGSIKAKKQELRDHRDHVLRSLERFDDWSIKWIPRKENQRADDLVNIVFSAKKPKCQKKKRKRS